MIGTMFSGYRILEKVGGGNTGVVYQAFDPRKVRLLALKILEDDFLLTKEKRARFLRESHAIQMLDHPAIARTYEAGVFNQHYFLAMEFVDGSTYGQIIQDHPQGIDLEMFFKIMLPILDGVGLAHRHSLAHRDLKPENLKINLKGQPKILDFGLVKFLKREGKPGEDSFQTMAGMVLGSAGYMSPEQANGEPLDARTDIFSLGILMYELLTGKNPFRSSKLFTTITKVLTATPISVELLRPDVPPKLGQTVLKCLAKDMNERFPNAGLLYETVRGLQV